MAQYGTGLTQMHDANALWYDYETEETDPPVNGRKGWLRLLALALATAAAAYIGYATLITG